MNLILIGVPPPTDEEMVKECLGIYKDQTTALIAQYPPKTCSPKSKDRGCQKR